MAVWRLQAPDPAEPLSEIAASPTPPVSAPSSAPASATLPRLPARSSIPTESEYQNRNPRTVPFEIVEGDLAVSFGDIILGKVTDAGGAKSGRHEPAPPQLWDRTEIPYLISPELPDPSRVEQAIQYFNQNTPVRFVPRTTQADAIVFEPGQEHCYSALGRTGGLQPIRLSAGCQSQQILHEIMHALGFVHEQSRTDRDEYVEVVWDNIDPRYHPQFAIVPEPLMEALRGTAFDFRSIMLYRPETFALAPGKAALKPQGGRPSIEPAQQGLSEGDIQRLKRLYRL